jgi:hypothetical protein
VGKLAIARIIAQVFPDHLLLLKTSIKPKLLPGLHLQMEALR